MKILKPLLYILLIAAVSLSGYYAWKFYIQAKAPILDALYTLPQDASVVLAFNDYQAFNKKIESENLIWQDIRNTYDLESTKSQLDSILFGISKNTNFKIALDNPESKLYISYHFAGANNFKAIYTLSLATAIDDDDIQTVLSKNYQVKTREFEGETIYIISQKGKKAKHYLTHISNVISLCPSESLAEKIILSAQSYTPESRTLEHRMLKMAGKDIPVNIFINYNYFYRLIAKYTNNELKNQIKNLRTFSQKATLDMLLQKDRVMLSGFSIQSDSFPCFLDTYKTYKPSEIRLTNILPASTSFLYYQGAHNLSDLLKSRSKGDFSERDEKRLQQFKARYLVDLGDYFYPWIKDEIAFAFTKTRSSDQNEGAYALLEATDLKEANQALSKLTSLIADIKKIHLDSTKVVYRSHEFHQIPYSGLLPMLFGNTFSAVQSTHYTQIDDYIIFANSDKALQNIIDNYLIERTLSNSDIYKSIIGDLSNETNILIYSNLHYIRPIISKYLSKDGIKLMDHSGLAFESFGSMAIEYIANDEGTYSTFVLHHGGKQEIDEPISWQTALDNPIVAGPYWIKNHKTNQNEVLVFDKENLMYRMDENGSIAWAIPVFEKPMSPVYMVDYYKNGKYQYMFNTKHYLHLYDLNGNKVENFPISLPKAASGAMTLIDYDNNKNYRILIPLSDKKVYNFQVDGVQTPGWKFPSMENKMQQAVQFFKLGTKDFLVISDTVGDVIYANRRGESRMSAKLSFTNNPNTPFFKKQKSNPKAIITTDLMGRVVSITANGKVDKLLLREFSNKHTFYYFDFDGDKYKDYIFIDKNSLFIYNHRNQLILQKDFDFNISSKIIGVNIKTQDDIRLILNNIDDQKIVFISKSGDIINNDKYNCNGRFITLEKKSNPNILRLTTAFDRIISSFLIK